MQLFQRQRQELRIVYYTREHPFGLVFEFMDRSNLRCYLRNNRDIAMLELVRFRPLICRSSYLIVPMPVTGNSSRREAHARIRYRPRNCQYCVPSPLV